MPLDRYTKTILTVIAGCLLFLCGRSLQSPEQAFAQSPVHIQGPVQLMQPVHVIIEGVALPKGLPVYLGQDPMKVRVVQ